MVKLDSNSKIILTPKDLFWGISVLGAGLAIWFTLVGKVENNADQIQIMQKAASNMEQDIEKIKQKTDDTHDAVIRITTILEHQQ